MTSTRSIDSAAKGYVRHRFVRALSASFVVFALFGIVALVAATLANAIRVGDFAQVVVAPLALPVVFVVFVLPIVFFVSLGGAIVDLLHRRLMALIVFASFGVVGFSLGAIAISIAIDFAGVRIFDTPDMPQGLELAGLGVFASVGALIGYECARQGWWQLTVAKEDFRAVRGWRPSPWRLATTFRRHLGLPSFLAYVGRRRILTSTLYFGVAVLNLGLLMLLMLPALGMTIRDQETTADFNPYVFFGGMIALLVLNLLGAGSLVARLADKRATKLYQNVREWDSRAPIVFLRSFNQDDAKLRAVGGDAFARWPAGVGRSRTLDEILLEHASPYGPVIAIGDPRDPTPPLGAARVFVEGAGAEWQDVVRGLAGASRAVVMCPNHGEGVQWELDLIAQSQGRLRIIFLASPELDRSATLALFERLVPSLPDIPIQSWPIAAYPHEGGWQVLTAKRLSVESYTVALNAALQALLGLAGVPLAQSKRPRLAAGALNAQSTKAV